MTEDLSPNDLAKFAAARRAADLVETGMRVGLGTGSTAVWLVRILGKRARAGGLDIRCVPTSSRTAAQARDEGLQVVTLDEVEWLDITIDGADEFDAALNLIKGGGGAHLQEKIVATASDRMVVIADAGKEVATLGAYPLPVEVVQFGWRATGALLDATLAGIGLGGRQSALRMAGDVPFVTDEGNFILDLDLGRIEAPRELALMLNQIPGVVENGLFIDIADTVAIGHPDGRVILRDLAEGVTEDTRVDPAEALALL